MENNKLDNLIPAVEFPKKFSFMSMGLLRKYINEEKYNGFDKVIVRIGRKILIDTNAFFAWLKEKNPNWAINEEDNTNGGK